MSEKRTDDERRGIILLSFEMPKGHMKKNCYFNIYCDRDLL